VVLARTRPPPLLLTSSTRSPGQRVQIDTDLEGHRNAELAMVDAGQRIRLGRRVALVDVDDRLAVVLLDPPEMRDPRLGVTRRFVLRSRSSDSGDTTSTTR
jgi:hypothetical protein